MNIHSVVMVFVGNIQSRNVVHHEGHM